MKKPEVNPIDYDQDTPEIIIDEILASNSFRIISIVMCVIIGILFAIFVYNIPVKEVFEKIVSISFVGVVIYGLSLIVNPDPKVIPRKKVR